MKKILVAGCSYAGINFVKSFLRLSKTPVEITVVEPRAGWFNIMAIPRILCDPVFAETSWVDLNRLNINWHTKWMLGDIKPVEIRSRSESKSPFATKSRGLASVNFIQGKVVDLGLKSAVVSRSARSPDSPYIPSGIVSNLGRLGPEKFDLEFDYCILAAGTSRNWPVDLMAQTKLGYLKETKEVSDRIKKANDIVIVGGGAVGIELSEIRQQHPNKHVTLVHPYPVLPPESHLPVEFKNAVVQRCAAFGIDMQLSTRVHQDERGLITTKGKKIDSDFTIWANRNSHNIDYLKNETFSSFITPKSDVSVSPFLELKSATQTLSNIYAIGDLASLGVIKKAGIAFRTAHVAAGNVAADIEGTTKKELSGLPGPKMAITVGSKANVQYLDGKVIVDSPDVMKSAQDYKNSKVWNLLGVDRSISE